MSYNKIQLFITYKIQFITNRIYVLDGFPFVCFVLLRVSEAKEVLGWEWGHSRISMEFLVV